MDDEIVRVPVGTPIKDTIYEYEGKRYKLHGLTKRLGLKYKPVYGRILADPERDIADILTECLQTPTCWLGAGHSTLHKTRESYYRTLDKLGLTDEDIDRYMDLHHIRKW